MKASSAASPRHWTYVVTNDRNSSRLTHLLQMRVQLAGHQQGSVKRAAMGAKKPPPPLAPDPDVWRFRRNQIGNPIVAFQMISNHYVNLLLKKDFRASAFPRRGRRPRRPSSQIETSFDLERKTGEVNAKPASLSRLRSAARPV